MGTYLLTDVDRSRVSATVYEGHAAQLRAVSVTGGIKSELLCINKCMFSKHLDNGHGNHQYLMGLEYRRRHAIEESIRGLQNIHCVFLQITMLPNSPYSTCSDRHQMRYTDLYMYLRWKLSSLGLRRLISHSTG